jgi:hypothetical protein
MSPQHKLMPTEETEMCDACDGSGFGVADTYCGKCGGAGGYPMTRPTTDVSTDGLVALVEALDPHRYIEGIGSQKWIDACHSMAPHAYKLRDQLKALQRSNAEKDEALLDIRNRILCPVGPSPTLDEIAQIARKALEDKTLSNGGGE